MKNLTLVLALTLGSTVLFAQSDGEKRMEEKRAEIERQKVAYITTQLELTPEESKAFWPLYERYNMEMDQFKDAKREEKREMRAQASEERLSEAEIDANMKRRFETERAKLALEESYYERFKSVLPAHKVAELYEVEREFKRELMKQMRDGREENEEMREERRTRTQEGTRRTAPTPSERPTQKR